MTRVLAGLRDILLAGVVVSAILPGPEAAAQEDPTLAPNIMLRSLQFVQDTVVAGDHSAGEMQRFMLSKIDQRLRTANPSIFEDPRNVDAALIYAMSGGNPATLEYLVSRDVAGNFDTRVADALRKYLAGKGTLIANSLGEMAREYRDQRIGAYVALVAGNVTVPKDVKAALEFYDMARLAAPGTIVEEAALRRSVAIAVDADLVDKGLAYSRKYARRFVHSPYASQFADFFVQLVVEHYPQVGEADIDGTIAFMDVDRRREVFLRIARSAAVQGKDELARLASAKAVELSGMEATTPETLAKLYGGLANIPTSKVGDAAQKLSAIPEEELTPRDRALRQAARFVADEVLRQPNAESLAQDPGRTIQSTPDASTPIASIGNDAAGSADIAPQSATSASVNLDPEFQTFVEAGRSKLSAIDDLLREEGVKP
ncbi:chemotaxis protein MotC [Pseudorhizobium tarimense]|uniref:Chemotaxis protein MotC n=1 Tax=Pseudorhizobium tarimense TaxID=1079109 RepID=A0ABV2HAN7_9HYPH|nr:chemotaxis protein MotC [Pseudorhizobium tarimense]MCJ8520846.1 chemotaxis protein MotC [Pseudorhizobium tarimense]